MPNRWDLDTNMLELLPPWYHEILDYQQIMQTEQAQFEQLAAAIISIADNFFIQMMDEQAVSLWEDILSIVPNLSAPRQYYYRLGTWMLGAGPFANNPPLESLEFRRARLISRLSSHPPFTLGFLYQKLDELIGPGEWTVTVDYPNYTLIVESSAQNQPYATEVAFTINRIKPAHIVYRNTPYLRDGLLLSETVGSATPAYFYKLGEWALGVSPFADYDKLWNYHLGSWQLGTTAFLNEKAIGVIKMPEIPSIQPALLTATANFVSGDVAAARLNGSIKITSLTKTLEGSTLTILYAVTPQQASAVTLVELLDANDTILTSSTVYVPITGTTMMKHTIPTKEGVLKNNDKQSN